MKRNLRILFGILVIIVVIVAFIKGRPNSSVSEIPNSKPPKVLDQVTYHGSRDKKKIALTFDACMTYGMERKLKSGKVKSYYNKQVIDELIKDHVPATLFLTGLWAKNYPEITKSLSENPLFEIGNHSYSHPTFTPRCYDLPRVANSDKEKEFQMSQDILTKITGKTPTLFRFPGGCFGKGDLQLARKYNLSTVQWDVDGRDAFNKDKNIIVKTAEKELKPGSIVILHMNDSTNAPATGDALPAIISFAKSQGYEFVKVSDLIF